LARDLKAVHGKALVKIEVRRAAYTIGPISNKLLSLRRIGAVSAVPVSIPDQIDLRSSGDEGPPVIYQCTNFTCAARRSLKTSEIGRLGIRINTVGNFIQFTLLRQNALPHERHRGNEAQRK